MAWLKSFCALLVYLMMVGFVAGNVVLMGENISKSFDDIEAKFTPKIKGSGENGILYLAEPIDACSPLENKVVGGSKPPFALIIRGRCSFDDKIRSAQSAGFKAAIIYDCVDGAPLIEMGGTPDLIKIHAVFISKSSGKVLKKYAGHTDVELWILPAFENSPWSIMAVSFISLLAMSAMLGTCFFVCKHHVRRERPRAPQVPEFQGMSCHLVKAMPSLIFTTVLEDNCTSRTCAICLEDYNKGEKLRILPCCHKFHAICVDSWLTAWRTFCPVCKRDARMTTSIPPASESTPLLSASESTPLLSSGAPSPSSTAALLSCHSSVAASPSIPVNSLAISPPLQIVSTSPWSAAASRTHSLSSTHHMANSHRSYNNSPGSSINRGFPDLRSIPSQRSQMPHLVSPHSIGLPLRSPYSSRFARPYTASSTDASPSYLAGSSGHCSYLRHSESMGFPLPSPYSSRYARPYNPSSTNASPSYLAGSSDHCSYLQPSESMGLPLPSPCSSRYALPNNASSSNASPSYLVGSSGRCSYLRHCESGASISALASAQSLPSC